MAADETLVPANELAQTNTARFPNEDSTYRQARNALLAEEIELRRHLWRVAQMRRALPAGGVLKRDYRFEGRNGEVGIADLFGEHDTLVVYSMMYGPARATGCPMCTSQLSAWDGIAPNLEKRIALAVVARSPYERIKKYGQSRHWRNLRLYSDPSGDFTGDFVGERDADMPGYTVFKREGALIRHFYSGEGGEKIADPGQDPHNAPDMNPLWIILDTTPEGRGTDWYPRLDDRPD